MRSRNLLVLAAIALAGLAVLATRRARRPDRQTPSRSRTEARLDEAIEETFPASDPIAVGQIE
jgi:hypothetical protein